MLGRAEQGLEGLCPGWCWGLDGTLGLVLCHDFALAGGRNREVAVCAAPSSFLGHGHGNTLPSLYWYQHFPGPVPFLVVPFVI